jgi:hypothetical protein
MSDIHVQPLDESGRPIPPDHPPAASPETVTFGRGDGRGLTARLRDHPRLRALRERRLPYSVVAVASAVIAGTAVAVYMDRPVEEVSATPPVTRVILEPESWLNVHVDPIQPPAPGEELEQMLAHHPSEAVVALPLERYQEHLLGLPPGTYHVRASCSAETTTLPAEWEGPAWFTVDVLDPGTYDPAPESDVDRDVDMVCDGDLHTVSARMTVTGYRAFHVYVYSFLDELAEEGGYEVPDVFAAVSFTPVS